MNRKILTRIIEEEARKLVREQRMRTRVIAQDDPISDLGDEPVFSRERPEIAAKRRRRTATERKRLQKFVQDNPGTELRTTVVAGPRMAPPERAQPGRDFADPLGTEIEAGPVSTRQGIQGTYSLKGTSDQKAMLDVLQAMGGTIAREMIRRNVQGEERKEFFTSVDKMKDLADKIYRYRPKGAKEAMAVANMKPAAKAEYLRKLGVAVKDYLVSFGGQPGIGIKWSEVLEKRYPREKLLITQYLGGAYEPEELAQWEDFPEDERSAGPAKDLWDDDEEFEEDDPGIDEEGDEEGKVLTRVQSKLNIPTDVTSLPMDTDRVKKIAERLFGENLSVTDLFGDVISGKSVIERGHGKDKSVTDKERRQVAVIQYILSQYPQAAQNLGNDNAEDWPAGVTGVFDEGTEKAVRWWQKQAFGSHDGGVGRQTGNGLFGITSVASAVTIPITGSGTGVGTKKRLKRTSEVYKDPSGMCWAVFNDEKNHRVECPADTSDIEEKASGFKTKGDVLRAPDDSPETKITTKGASPEPAKRIGGDKFTIETYLSSGRESITLKITKAKGLRIERDDRAPADSKTIYLRCISAANPDGVNLDFKNAALSGVLMLMKQAYGAKEITSEEFGKIQESTQWDKYLMGII